MDTNNNTCILALATFFGPVVAVGITLYVQRISEKRQHEYLREMRESLTNFYNEWKVSERERLVGIEGAINGIRQEIRKLNPNVDLKNR